MRTRLGLALLAAAVLAPTSLDAQSSWLDRVPSAWTRTASIPAPPESKESRQTLAKRCAPFVARGGAVDPLLEKAGWMPFLHLDRRLTRDDIDVIGGMAAAGPACEPAAFNLFVFVGGRFAGTLSPVPMTAMRDGAAGAVRLTGADALTAEFARYGPTDPECCPSSVMRVTYRINRSGAAPIIEATEARRVR